MLNVLAAPLVANLHAILPVLLMLQAGCAGIQVPWRCRHELGHVRIDGLALLIELVG